MFDIARDLTSLAENAAPIRIAVIGCGKFASMFLAQATRTPGLHVVTIADLNPSRARTALNKIGWPAEKYAATSADQALRTVGTWITDDARAAIEAAGIDVVIEATGNPIAGTEHALMAIAAGRHVVMVNVEADVLCGPALSMRAARAGVSTSYAYGDQPALIVEMVDWAATIGLPVTCAGKGTLHQANFHASTPETVWDHYGLTPERAASSGMNPKMFNSFLDGTKSAIEMAAVVNATDLAAPENGLLFPPVGTTTLQNQLIPKSRGGLLSQSGTVEVVSSRDTDGNDLPDGLRWGVYLTFEAPDDYVTSCFKDYGLQTDKTGQFAALWRPYHLIGLELGVSVARLGLLGRPTGQAKRFSADVVCVAKRDLSSGDILDGEGGDSVWGTVISAERSLSMSALPMGLSDGARLIQDEPKGAIISRNDVILSDDLGRALALRTETEAMAGNF